MEHTNSKSADPIACVTIITATNPERLTKRAILRKGQLEFDHGGSLVAGKAEVRSVEDHAGFAALLQSLEPSQALTYGVPEATETPLTTQNAWKEEGCPDGTIPRTNATFAWPEGPAVVMLDYDPDEGADVLSPEALVEVIRAAAPGLKDAAMLHMPSASSFIKNGKTGEDLTGLRGQRLYIFVEDGRDIPRAGQALFDRLWLAGHGYMKISKAGSLLTRSIIDATVWQPSRLDFAAGAKCAPPLVQDRGTPRLFEGALSKVDTKTALPDLSEHEGKLLKHLHDQARAAKEPESEETRAAWLEARAIEMVGPNASVEEIAAARTQAKDALESSVLPGDFILDVMVDGTVKKLSVADVLDAPQKYDRAKTRDAFEPDYDSGRIVGMLYLDGPVKTLHSFARGGITYRLERNLKFITILKGQLDKAVDETLEVLRDHPDFYDFGDELVWLSEGQIYPLDQHRLDQKFGGLIQFQSYDARGNLLLRDPPPNLTKRVLSLRHIRKLKPLSAVITAPTLRPDGSILDIAGYDAETQLFYHKDRDAPRVTVPLAPSKNEAAAALGRLMTPFADFPFVETLDRSIFLGALLTAAVRGILPTSPGFGFDAPVQGSGKTLLAQCIAAMAGDRSPAVYPHVSGRDDEEVRKRLMSFFRTGAAAMVWDNVLGTFDSASFAAALTSETFTDRVLGRSEVLTVPNKAIFLLTGNNLTLQGDMVRRIIVARIDPGTDRPFARSFDLDPLQYVREHRSALIAAALTLMRGYLASDAPKPDGRMASFEAWSDLVRNTVCWIAGTIGRGDYDDPMRAVTRALEHDPDLELHADLLEALHEKFKGEPFTAADIHRSIGSEPSLTTSGPAHKVWVSLTAINPNAARSASTIGMTLRYRKDRIARGLVLRTSKDSHTKKSHWWIEEMK